MKKLIDMGSWTWKMLRFFWKKNFWCVTTWYEIDLANSIIARILNKIFVKQTTIIRWNYFISNLADFDIIYIYLYPELVSKIEDKIKMKQKKGTINRKMLLNLLKEM